MSFRPLFILICIVPFVSACAAFEALPDDPFDGAGPALVMVPVNHTDRYIPSLYLDQYWGANADAHGGGRKGVCCYPGLKDWRKPVNVTWRWGQEEDSVTRAITLAGEDRSAVVNFPPGGPKRSSDTSEDEAYLCVIFRELNKVELAFATKGSACARK